jgi:hypothetical protein
LSTHAVETTEAPRETGIGLQVLRYLDLVVLAAALPVFLVAGLPLLGYAATGAAWLAQRAIQAFAYRRAVSSGDRRSAIGILAGSLFGRLWLVCLSVLGAGLIEREAGLAAGVLAATLFTVFFCTLLVLKPIEEGRR